MDRRETSIEFTLVDLFHSLEVCFPSWSCYYTLINQRKKEDLKNNTHNFNLILPKMLACDELAIMHYQFNNELRMKKNITFFCFMLLLSVKVLAQDIIITEINWSPIGLEDLEYIELYNNSGSAIDMAFYEMQGVEIVFPAYTFPAGEYILVGEEQFNLEFRFPEVTSFQWSGSLSNNGETIAILNSSMQVIDEVTYVPSEDDMEVLTGTPLAVDGRGCSLELCDMDADNDDMSNWQASTQMCIFNDYRPYYGTPGAPNMCSSEPFAHCQYSKRIGVESETIFVSIYFENPNALPSSVEIAVDPSSTASEADYTILNGSTTITSAGGTLPELIPIEIEILDDTEVEGLETLIINVTASDNIGSVTNDQITYVIMDEDTAPVDDLIILGVFDAFMDDNPKKLSGVELYALNDISDLSAYSLGTANSGGGTDGIEVQLQGGSLAAGESYFIVEDSIRFSKFFDFYPEQEHFALWINGDDAIELFHHATLIDVFGEQDTDGTGTEWEYIEGWAYRRSNTGPDGDVFQIDNWTFSGIELLDGTMNNTSTNPYPLGSYEALGVEEFGSAEELIAYPNPATDQLYVKTAKGLRVSNMVVMSVDGKEVISMDSGFGETSTVHLDIQKLERGVYFILMETSQGEMKATFSKK